MIIHTWYRNHFSYAVEAEASRPFRGDLADDCPYDDPDGDIAEICRMIELSGMIGLECGLLEAGTLDAAAAVSPELSAFG